VRIGQDGYLCESPENASVFFGAAALFSRRHKPAMNEPQRPAQFGAAVAGRPDRATRRRAAASSAAEQ